MPVSTQHKPSWSSEAQRTYHQELVPELKEDQGVSWPRPEHVQDGLSACEDAGGEIGSKDGDGRRTTWPTVRRTFWRLEQPGQEGGCGEPGQLALTLEGGPHLEGHRSAEALGLRGTETVGSVDGKQELVLPWVQSPCSLRRQVGVGSLLLHRAVLGEVKFSVLGPSSLEHDCLLPKGCSVW